MASETPSFHSSRHDHERCTSNALQDAAALCAQRGARFTPLRQRVLEIVWQARRPVGAYDILKILGEERGSSAPPTVYRALEFLLEHGLLHRLSSLNAFVGCSSPSAPGAHQFLICRQCGSAAELNDKNVERAILKSAESLGFTPERHVVEITGVCPNCH